MVLEESTTYQAILRKSRLAEARRFLLLIAEDKFGKPSPAAMAAINALEDADQLEQVGRRVNKVNSGEKLLTVPAWRRNGLPDASPRTH